MGRRQAGGEGGGEIETNRGRETGGERENERLRQREGRTQTDNRGRGRGRGRDRKGEGCGRTSVSPSWHTLCFVSRVLSNKACTTLSVSWSLLHVGEFGHGSGRPEHTGQTEVDRLR